MIFSIVYGMRFYFGTLAQLLIYLHTDFLSFFKKIMQKQIQVSGFPSIGPNGIYIEVDERHNGMPRFKHLQNSYNLYAYKNADNDTMEWHFSPSDINNDRKYAYFGEGIEHPCLFVGAVKYLEDEWETTNQVKIKYIDARVSIVLTLFTQICEKLFALLEIF